MEEWTDLLNEDQYIRLCECRSIMADVPALIQTQWAWNQINHKKMTKEDTVVQILELLDANSQWGLAAVATEEFDELINGII